MELTEFYKNQALVHRVAGLNIIRGWKGPDLYFELLVTPEIQHEQTHERSRIFVVQYVPVSMYATGYVLSTKTGLLLDAPVFVERMFPDRFDLNQVLQPLNIGIQPWYGVKHER